MVDHKITVAIIGASGYTGGELVRLLADHPSVHIEFLSGERNASATVGSVHPWLRNHPRVAKMRFRPIAQMPEVDIAFGCLPTGALPKYLSHVSSRAKRIINLAGDFRLRDPEELRNHYPDSAEVAEKFTYFVPELSTEVGEGRFINLPGCMAVASIYALYPLFANELVQPRVVVDAKTGSSGGGRGTSDHPAERAGNFRVHKPHGHRHSPEVRQAITDFTGQIPQLQFSTYSLDVPRGILVTGYAQLREGVSALEVKRAFAAAYVGQPFVRLRSAPKKPQDFPMLKAVIGSNLAEVSVNVRADEVVAVCAIDNLVKGAAGQAVQAMNLITGIEETQGLPTTAVGP
ncbi:N-acetyl-gamma-glutamyl-phosphate reductase [Natronoglycomyces albus]|uniref:N-acetyl-gamma-glutamyl-phosphate reductase n=1 Tax=Natronoglycomyces albus TaxID=2811108 RepID=A0A895XEA9_9ACTN|nr:N-acetyl-gamma-glutamyl-phosphate reductase [Natronoglycomyces albus]QSB04161.1 N-acetyl-gamma-glutamyl-phosphate reductase [Natronoglycomyces albus]